MSHQTYLAQHIKAGDEIHILHAPEFANHTGTATKDAEPEEVRGVQMVNLEFQCTGDCSVVHHAQVFPTKLVNAERVHKG